MCNNPVARGDRRENTQVGIEVQLRVEVVRFAEVVVVDLKHDGDGGVTIFNVIVQQDDAIV